MTKNYPFLFSIAEKMISRDFSSLSIRLIKNIDDNGESRKFLEIKFNDFNCHLVYDINNDIVHDPFSFNDPN